MQPSEMRLSCGVEEASHCGRRSEGGAGRRRWIATAVAFTCVDERARQLSAAADPAIALELARVEITNLNEAVSTRTTIGEAIGLLMREKTLTAKAAFEHLVELSSHTNINIREIAARLVEEADARAERGDSGVQCPVAVHRRVSPMTSRLR